MIRSMTLAALAALLLATPVRAQDEIPTDPEAQTEDVAPAAPSPRAYFRAYAFFDATALAAPDTFDAIIGKTNLQMFGGGGEVFIWKGLFARVAFSSTTETGSRAELHDGEVIPLGIPLTVELRPFELAGGWRFNATARARVVPYAGGGLLRMGYKETSDFATSGDNTNTTFTGGVVFGGVEVRPFSWIVTGAEVQYRSVPNALGDGGLSQAFDEHDLGGVTVRVLVGIRR